VRVVEAEIAQSAVGMAGIGAFLIWSVKRLIENADKAAAEQAKAVASVGDRMVCALDKLDARLGAVSDSLSNIQRDIAATRQAQDSSRDELEQIKEILDDDGSPTHPRRSRSHRAVNGAGR